MYVNKNKDIIEQNDKMKPRINLIPAVFYYIVLLKNKPAIYKSQLSM